MAPVPVHTRDLWIPLRDGVRLAARVWLPHEAAGDPVPAVGEAIPYRLSDGTAADDRRRWAYVAAHGYACVRIDLRGTGNSGGLMLDEYLPSEADDLVEAIAWIAAQPWCTGAVGMTGISWGGFNSLQVAARRPPALRAVISLCASDDRYADDVHYRGGCVLGLDMLHWATNMLALNARPPDPAVVGDGWRDAWLGHQRRDAYWRQGSVCEDHSAISAAVLAVGGWADGYTDAVLRLLAGLPGPRRGLIGPWGHPYPDDGGPAPSIGFLQECVRWWDHWLKGIETGVMEEPMLRAWMQEPVAPAPTHTVRPGRSSPCGPSARRTGSMRGFGQLSSATQRPGRSS